MAMHRRHFLSLLGTTGLAAAYPGFVPASEMGDNEYVQFLRAEDDKYDAHRQLFNKRLQYRPLLIALCRSERGVQLAVQLAGNRQLPVAIRSGGHSFEGYSLNNGGLVIDLTLMNRHTLHEDARLVAQPATRLMQLYEDLIPRGRLLPAGSCGMVGLAGLTLGGGYGLFSRQHGLTCDRLTRLRMVTANGEVMEVSEGSELMWACRGGGNGHFGVVTELEYQTVTAPPTITRYLYKARKLTPARAVELVRHWFELTASLPVTAFAAFVLNGRTLTLLITDTAAEKDATMESIDRQLSALTDKRYEPRSDELLAGIRRYYGRLEPLYFKNASAGYYRGFQDIEAVAEQVFKLVGESRLHLFQINTLGGAINDEVAARNSCYPHRSFGYLAEVQSYWEKPSQQAAALHGVEAIQSLLRENGIRSHYSNYPDGNFMDWAHAYYGEEGYLRLQRLKGRLDPDNRFNHPQSVKDT